MSQRDIIKEFHEMQAINPNCGAVYNGNTAVEWYTLYCQAILRCKRLEEQIEEKPGLLDACRTAMEACQQNLVHRQWKDEVVLLTAFDACKKAMMTKDSINKGNEMSGFTDDETLSWIRAKIATTGLLSVTNRDVYGSMHILAADRRGMEAYIRSAKCEHKQGVIANLTAGLHSACDTIDSLDGDSYELRNILECCEKSLEIAENKGN